MNVRQGNNRYLRTILLLLIAFGTPGKNYAVGGTLLYPTLVKQFYALNNNQLFWMQDAEAYKRKRLALLSYVNNADKLGLAAKRYHQKELINYSAYIPGNAEDAKRADYLITDAAIALCKDIYQGSNINQSVSYDAISGTYKSADNNYLLQELNKVNSDADITTLMNMLEPQTSDYMQLKNALAECRPNKDAIKLKQLVTSMNYYRWIWHFHLDSFIVVNIASATLRYYKKDNLLLNMRAVLGQPNKKTPRFAAYCSEVTLYPYWYMPRSIAVNEWLNSFKRNPRLLPMMNMVVINNNGNIISPYSINWSKLNKSNFAYQIREATGCSNPLGVIKFTLTSPYAVYMHDTNLKDVFSYDSRYRSHGCIRLQDPVGLANALLAKPVDTAFLQACFSNQQPVVQTIPKPVPTFVVYMTASVNEGGAVEYYKDIYKLL